MSIFTLINDECGTVTTLKRDKVDTTHDLARLFLDFTRAIGYDYVTEVSLKYYNGTVARSDF